MIKKNRLTKELSWISADFSARPREENQANKGMPSKYMFIEGCPSDPFVLHFLSRGVFCEKCQMKTFCFNSSIPCFVMQFFINHVMSNSEHWVL